MKFRGLLVCLVGLTLSVRPAISEENTERGVRLLEHGAQCNGDHDDTNAFRAAIAAAPAGGAVLVPAGHCVVSGTIDIGAKHPVSLIGVGLASQIFETGQASLFRLNGVQGQRIKSLYLGSAATQPGTALLDFIDAHRNRVEDVTMLGGYYGLHLFGSLLNAAADLRSGANIGGFFGSTSTNQVWVFAERDHTNQISANANTFINPVLEGGINGIVVQDGPDASQVGSIRDGQGSLQILGGTIEGVRDVALTFDRTFLGSSVTGTHFEANGIDIVINSSANIRLTAITSIDGAGSGHGIQIGGSFTKNVQISDSIVQEMTADPATVSRLQLQNITTDLNCIGTSAILPNAPWAASVIYVNVRGNCT